MLFRLLNQGFHHIAAHIAVFPAAEVAVIALLEIDAQFPGDFILHVIQSTAGFGHIDAIAVENAKGSELSLENATSGMTVPLHAGAAKYFEEKGYTAIEN